MRERGLIHFQAAPASTIPLDGVSVAREIERIPVLLRIRVIEVSQLRDLNPLLLSFDDELLLQSGLLKAALVIAD